MTPIRARDLVDRFGAALIGHVIDTEKIGDWLGGLSKVVKICPDKNALEIVMQVCHQEHGEIGIFSFETVWYDEREFGDE